MKMKKNLKLLLKPILSEKELPFIPRSFDVVGDILIFADFPEELVKKEGKIGETILSNFRNIKVVAKKTKQYGGKFRTPTLKIIAGEKRKETIHKENGISLKLHVENVYFSPRLSTERKRIRELVKKRESILVLFSGCGPYTTDIAKNTACKEVFGVEINPKAHEYALLNAKKNKVEKRITLFQGDVTKILPTIKKKFDRIVMPLPKEADKHLGVALFKIKKGGTIHLYTFGNEEDIKNSLAVELKTACKEKGKTCKIKTIVRCGQYSPGKFRICVDFTVK